ncbi:E3 ubiquitin-protein ligase ZNRF4-like, partial [Hemicordylus capensis]|uniref:E3 ubiquitin-protein ligase ZNRF4-like n=1 Tax=Hemicordylus capensis TaxID=884348 RepID=UPI0023028848
LHIHQPVPVSIREVLAVCDRVTTGSLHFKTQPERKPHPASLSLIQKGCSYGLLTGKEALIRAVYNHNGISQDFVALPSHFGPSLQHEGLLGYVIEAQPANACHPIEAPPSLNGSFIAFIALIRRYDCPFTTKVLHAQRAGYQGAIVHNVNSQALVTMLSDNEDIKQQVTIPSLFIAESASTQLRRIFHYDHTAYVILIPECHWLSCWDVRHNCPSNPPTPKPGIPNQSFPCLPMRCHFLNNVHFLLFCLMLVIWIVALFVLCCAVSNNF